MQTHARVGARLKELRLKYNLTQAYLAKAIGCWPSAISNLERGEKGSMELMEGVLWALGLEMSDLKLGEHGGLISIQRGRRQQATLGMRKAPQRSPLQRERLRATA
jgi:transcriptional regulator with XRE-family HTH domain